MADPGADQPAGPYDDVVLELQRLRRSAGDPSYAEVARLVARRRQARGVPPEMALPARTTVYDAFRLGRRRLDRDLVADLTVALEREAVRLSRAGRAVEAPTVPGSPATPSVPAVVGPDPDHVDVPPETPAAPDAAIGVSARQRLVILAFCVATNLVGLVFIDALEVPIWLDMIGTAVAAITLGPWWGVGVGVSSSLLDGVLSGQPGYWFTPVTAVGALLWGYGVRRFGMARTTGRFFLLNVWVALASTTLAVPVTVLAFGAYTPHDSSRVTEALADHLPWLVLAVFVSNLIFSLLDKLVSGFVALTVIESMERRWPWLTAVLRR